MDMKRSPSSIGSVGAGASSVLSKRGTIAAQACERCRHRKQRCDEQKPRCGACGKLNLECSYREPQPTKKDNTLQEILRRLTSLEKKVDDIGSKGVAGQTQDMHPPSVQDRQSFTDEDYNSMNPSIPLEYQPTSEARKPVQGYVYTPSTRSMMEWPVMQHLPETTGTKGKGSRPRESSPSSAPAAVIEDGRPGLSLDGLASTAFSTTGSSTPASFHYQNSSVISSPVASVIGWETIQPLSKGYFDTFNQLHPIVDEEWFLSHTAIHIINGIENTPASALAFLVLALGEVALAGNAPSISQIGGRPSGIRGGTLDQPPGIVFFNEARRRLGLFVTEVSVENLQVLLLSALFYASCGRAGDCWRTAASATIICQTLASRVYESHASHELIRRLFYHCTSATFVLGAELLLPITDLEHLRSHVGLPDFAGGQSEEDYLANQTSQFSDYGQSQIFAHRFFSGLYTTFGHSNMSSPSDTIHDKIRYLNEQLERWRELLPPHLTWEDGQFLGFGVDEFSAQVLIANSLMDSNMAYPYLSMMQLALVRSQYCVGRHIIFRYYVYKALHHADSLQPEDYRGAAECLKASLKWPITMAPPSMNKRLVPIPFYWSQNICGALVLLHLAHQHPVLSHIRTNYCGGQQFDYEVSETIELYIQWLRDMKQICATSERCWNMIRPLYSLRD